MTMQSQASERPLVTPESVSGIIESSVDPFDSSPGQVIKAAKKIVGAIHALALAEGIVPPEAAIDVLPEEHQHTVLDLFEVAIDEGAEKPKKPLKPDTANRIGRVLRYFAGEEERIAS